MNLDAQANHKRMKTRPEDPRDLNFVLDLAQLNADLSLLTEGRKGVHFLMVNGRLFNRVAADFPKHLLPCVTPCIFGTVINASDSDLRDLVG